MRVIDKDCNFKDVRLTYDGKAEIMPLEKALALADADEMDLVCVSEDSNPPVCKILDYQKYIYNQKKNKKVQKAVPQKEIRLGCNIAQHDIDIKVNQAIKFLKDGDIVKVSIVYRGRQMAFINSGLPILEKISETLSQYGKLTKKPKIEGYSYSMTFEGRKG